MPVTMTPVDSTNISQIGYDPETRQLHVHFAGATRHTYIYEDVPSDEYDRFLNADSKGKYFRKNISQQYKHQRLPLVEVPASSWRVHYHLIEDSTNSHLDVQADGIVPAMKEAKRLLGVDVAEEPAVVITLVMPLSHFPTA